MSITECDGYKKLVAAVEHDEKKSPNFHDYRGKLNWVVARAEHYAEKTGLAATSILDEWEKKRSYWYMNYYQEANQPEIKDNKVRIFNTVEEAKASMRKLEFRCPGCEGISTNPYECNAKEECDWKSYGLLGTAGRGIYVFVKSELNCQEIFMPVAWETDTRTSPDGC